jgi:hypothetical protein
MVGRFKTERTIPELEAASAEGGRESDENDE